jgi:hypothetical protein
MTKIKLYSDPGGVRRKWLAACLCVEAQDALRRAEDAIERGERPDPADLERVAAMMKALADVERARGLH